MHLGLRTTLACTLCLLEMLSCSRGNDAPPSQTPVLRCPERRLGFDELSPLGVSARTLLERFGSPRTATLRQGDPSQRLFAAHSSDARTLTVSFEAAERSGTYVRCPGASGGALSIRVVVELRFPGAASTVFPAILASSNADQVSLTGNAPFPTGVTPMAIGMKSKELEVLAGEPPPVYWSSVSTGPLRYSSPDSEDSL